MYAFEYHCADDFADVERVFKNSDDAKLLAGGQTLLASLKLRLAQPDMLIDLRRIDALKGIDYTQGKVVIGALTCHADVAASQVVKEHIPALSTLASNIGDPAVRNMGTLGGSLANNDPAADYPAAVLAMAATVNTNKRQIQADDFFTGMFDTLLDPGEVIVSVAFPAPQAAAYVKFKQAASRFALAGVFVAKVDGNVRVAITGAGACVYRDAAIESLLNEQFKPEQLDGYRADPSDLNSDLHASAQYRAHLVNVLAKKAVALAVGR